MDQAGQRDEIAYVLFRYPISTQTFLMRELLELESHGYCLHIYSLEPPDETDRECKPPVNASVTYLSRLDRAGWFQVIRNHAWCCLRHPVRYPRALIHTIRSQDHRHRLGFFAAASIARSLARHPTTGRVHAYFAAEDASAALIAHWLTGLPFSFVAHASDLFASPSVLCDKVKEASFVVTISEFNRTFIGQRCNAKWLHKIHVVRQGLDLEQFNSVYHARLQKSRVPNNQPFSILTVARLVTKKGHAYLAEALALLRDRGVDFRWTVVGDGPEYARLTQIVQTRELADRVHFVGQVPFTHVLNLLHDADCFVLPCIWAHETLADGIPAVLVEAMAAGLPVISTPVSGIPELIHDGTSGLLVEQKNSEALAIAIQALMSDADLRERLAAAGRARVVEDWDIASTTRTLRALFGESDAGIST